MLFIHNRFALMGILALLFSGVALARIDTYVFKNPQQEALYQELTQELRCLVCQNQNIADSNAELAKDLRRKTYQMIVKGEDKDAIVKFMVARYGDFVMYKPPFKATTVILWLGPALIFMLGVVMLTRMIRRRPLSDKPLLTDEQRQRAAQMLEGEDDVATKQKHAKHDSTEEK